MQQLINCKQDNDYFFANSRSSALPRFNKMTLVLLNGTCSFYFPIHFNINLLLEKVI